MRNKVYLMPNYIIIILNKGKGNIFYSKLEIRENFAPSAQFDIEKECKFELGCWF